MGHAPARVRLLAIATVAAAAGAGVAIALADEVDVATTARVLYSSSHQVSNTNNRVSGVGDVNGDGRPDVAYADPAFSIDPDLGNGRVTVVLGLPAGNTDSFDAIGARGFHITGIGSSQLGASVSAAGDVNGDGLADIVVGVPFLRPGGGNAKGGAFVIFGSTAPTDVSAGSLGARGFEIDGVTDFGQAGFSVAGVGDITGDGLADVAVGAPRVAGPAGTRSGVVFLVPGQATTTAVSLGAVKSITGAAPDDVLGMALAGPGDVDGGGKPDILAGAPGFVMGGIAGNAHLIHGESLLAGGPSYPVTSVARTWTGQAQDALGTDLDGAGDLDGDGRPELVINAVLADTPARAADGGRIWVVHGGAGNAGGTGTTTLNAVTADAWPIEGPAGSAAFVYAVSSAGGDVTGDGRPDLLLGSPFIDSDHGAAWLVSVPADAFTVPAAIDLAAPPASTRKLKGDGSSLGRIAFAVDGVGDVDGDGKLDVALSTDHSRAALMAGAGSGGSTTTGTTTGAPPATTPATTTPTTTPPPATTPAAQTLKAANVIKLPSNKKCVSRRRFRIRLVVPKGRVVTRAEVFVNAKRVKVVKNRRLTSTVDLRGLPKGRFTVKITLTVKGQAKKLTTKRAYRTCVPRRR